MTHWQEGKNVRRGFLYERFRVFHIKDRRNTEFEFHSHVFHKLIILLSGSVSYNVEAQTYLLKPWDVLLVAADEIHRPLIDSLKEYERVIIWVHDSTLKELSVGEEGLDRCFAEAKKRKWGLIPSKVMLSGHFKQLVRQLISSGTDEDFGNGALRQALFVQLMVLVNRGSRKWEQEKPLQREIQDPRIPLLLDHINAHLSEDLSIQKLAGQFYLSRFYLMHQFKAETGFTLHQYIQRKRLSLANQLVRQGATLTAASMDAGFSDYSTFLRAYKKQYGQSPRAYLRDGWDAEETDPEE